MKVHNRFIKAFGALLIAALLFGAMPAGEVRANDIPSSTIVFESVTGYSLTDNGDGTYSGVIPVKVDGGFDIFAKEGAEAFLDGVNQIIGVDHDAWPTWTPDTPDWYQYSLHLYEESGVQKWALRNHAGATETVPWYTTPVEPMGVPMSGTMHWGTMYAEETDVGAYLPGTGTAESVGLAETEGGGAGYWDMDWSWGSEAVPLEYPGFEVSIEDLGSGDFRVTFTPAEGPVKNITSGTTYATIQTAIDAASDGDTIEVYPGAYIEGATGDAIALNLDVPNLTLKSTDGRDVTTVDAGGATSGVWVLANLGDVTFDGFTVENFTENGIVQSYSQRIGTAFHVLNNFVDPSNGYLRNGLQVSGDGSTVFGNIVYGAPLTDKWASTGIGVINANNVVVEGNTVQQDIEDATNPDIGINVMNYSALTSNVTLENNTVTNAGNGIRISAANSTYVVQNVTIQNNILEENNKGINVQTVSLDGVTITGNTIWKSYDEIDGEETEFGTGIRFSNESATVTNASISGNTFSDNETYQVFGHAGATIDVAAVLSANTFDKAVTIDGENVIYSTIQAAVDDADPGDTVNVYSGTYEEQVVINKDLTLIGIGDPVITPPATIDAYTFAESSATWEPVVLAYGGTADESNNVSGTETINFSMSGFMVDGADRVPSDRSAGILLRNVVGTVSDNTVQNMHVDGKQTFGILAYGDSTVTIDSNTVSGYARGGIAANGDGGTLVDPVATITNNTVTGPGMNAVVTWAPNGIQIGWGATGSIEGNTVSGNGWPGSEWTGSGIIIYGSDGVLIKDNETYNNETAIVTSSATGTQIEGNFVHDNEYGINTQTGSVDTTITGNTVQENDAGIFVGSGSVNTIITHNIVTLNIVDGIDVYGSEESKYPTGTVIEYNQIYDNNTGDQEECGGLWVLGGIPTIDASPNWWGTISGPADDQIYGDVSYIPWCGDAECSFLVYPLEGEITETVTITEPTTYLLKDGTSINTGGACFDIQSSNVTIMTESPGGAVCYPGSPGIQIAIGESNIIIEGLEIDGEETAVGHGIHFLGAVEDVIISDTYIHDMDGDAVHFTAVPAGYVEIKGNLFKNNTGVGVNNEAATTEADTIDATYNAWGDYDGPTDTTDSGDGVSTYVTYEPWTHVDVYVADGVGTRYVNEVALGEDPAEEITYNVYANLQNAYGAQFTLSFDPAKLQVLSTSTAGTVFPYEWTDGTTETVAPGIDASVPGKITFAGGAMSAVSGTDQFLFSVSFVGVVPTDVDNPLFFDEADVDLYGMNPTYGSSLNIYAAGMEGVADVNVYDLPTLTIDPLATFAVGNVKEFTLTVTNPATGRAYTDLDIDLSGLDATLEYWDGTAWVTYTQGDDIFIGELAVDSTATVDFRIIFTGTTNVTATVNLEDDAIFLVMDTFEFIVLDAYTVTGTVQMQGRTERAGVLVALSNATEYGYDTLSTNIITDNYTLLNVADGTYDLSITHDRYLDFSYTGLVLTSDILDLTRLELRGGDVEKDNLIDIFDASLVGINYGAAGNNAADANFDGTVNIQDLAMIGGNFDLTSATAYTTWAP